MENLLGGLQILAQWQNFLVIPLGLAIGIVVGAIPGLTSDLGLILCIPLTYGMDPTMAVLMLLAIYCGGTYGGSITAILINTPGTGGGLAAFIAYNQVKQSSKHPETFGTGEIEGVAVSESANNGACGATMIPMLTLGVPGDGSTAILMGAFMLHGMVPGPSLFEEQGNVLYAIMLGLIVVNVFMYIIGSLFTRFYAHITRIPYEILAPIVLTFCIAGSYSTNNRVYDIYIILIFGIISYFLRRMDFQLVPILLGIVLGPLGRDGASARGKAGRPEVPPWDNSYFRC